MEINKWTEFYEEEFDFLYKTIVKLVSPNLGWRNRDEIHFP